MLRRQLLIRVAPLIVLLLTAAVTAILLLQGVLGDVAPTPPETPAVHLTEQAARLRHIVLGLSVAFLVVINVFVIVLFRAAGLILRPVDKLIAATRLLAAGRFDTRVDINQHDEFGELAVACNLLAEQLQAQERQRIETLAQVALALNHELNNCITIIDLQLVLLTRQASGSPGVAACLRQINASLRRITRALESLKHVRRIVLTDYAPGTKMLDLELSTRDDSAGEAPLPRPVTRLGPAHVSSTHA